MPPIKPASGSSRHDDLRGVFRPFTRLGSRRGKNPNIPPVVTIFGAGIAGLSAAHELIERGFSVQVVEPTRSPDEENAVEVGGMARNQFGRVQENPAVLHGPEPTDEEARQVFYERIERVLLLRSSQMQQVQQRFPIPWRVCFKRDPDGSEASLDPNLTDQWGTKNEVKLRSVWEALKDAYVAYMDNVKPRPDQSRWEHENPLPADWRCREILLVEIRGHTDGDFDERTNRRHSREWAQQVFRYLEKLNTQEPIPPIPVNQFEHHFRIVDVGSAEPLGDQRDATCRRFSNRVEFRIVEEYVPGEHGYRFFPAFYRHLFDTMRRTPILDEHDRETGQTACDRLRATNDMGLSVEDGKGLSPLQTRRVRSFEEFRKILELFFERLNVTQRDVARFHARLLKFMTSSSARRRQEYQDQSWWQFVGGHDERGYSPAMARYLSDTPQALVAMSATETDARSQGNVVSQLLLHYLFNEPDLTLNGPTTAVWLRDWKRYLKRQGVRFFVGELGTLTWDEDELVPQTGHKSGWLAPPAGPPEPAVGQPEQQGQVFTYAPAGPGRQQVDIIVLGDEDGDYTILVGGMAHSYRARGNTRDFIAQQLAATVNGHDAVSAYASNTVVRITSKDIVRLPDGGKDAAFDDSLQAGTWKTVRKFLTQPGDDGQQKELLRRVSEAKFLLENLNRVTDMAAEGIASFRRGGPPPRTGEVREPRADRLKEAWGALLDKPEELGKRDLGDAELRRMVRLRLLGKESELEFCDLNLADWEWEFLGRRRAADPAFDQALSDVETARRPRRELVPCIDVDAARNELRLRPPQWVLDAHLGEGRQPRNFAPMFPYYFRTRRGQPGGVIEHEQRPTLWISVENADDNLRVLDLPIPEDPEHEYMSQDQRTDDAFKPDFYVLALPFQEASKLVWRAERERPGSLDGVFAELLEFDRRTNRRSTRGEPLRMIRDRFGRPPSEYPLRDLSGIQYYFHNNVRIGKGHIYYSQAEWGLSSISQLAYWRERMTSTGAFMGQVSVDIGDFYAPAPARRGELVGRTAWHSSHQEIAQEVWWQVRDGLQTALGGELTPPDYFHLDEGLTFGLPEGGSFRDSVAILVRPRHDDSVGQYTVWINGERFEAEGSDFRTVADALCKQIDGCASGSLKATSEPPMDPADLRPSVILVKTVDDAREMVSRATLRQLDDLEDEEQRNLIHRGGREPVLRAIYLRRKQLIAEEMHGDAMLPPDADRSGIVIRVRSKVPAGSALVSVMAPRTGGDQSDALAGSYEITIGGKAYRHPQTRSGEPIGSLAECGEISVEQCAQIRDHLFELLIRDRDLEVMPELLGSSGLLLHPINGRQLPPIRVHNDRQNLTVVFGSMLNVRLEESSHHLAFAEPETATIGSNRTPFLINIPSQWAYRPGVNRAPRSVSGIADPAPPPEVVYRISKRRWVAAGTYMATTTRLTTMEAANESGRHAVNAILDTLATTPGADYNSQGRSFGDPVEIWDPERNELLDDLEPLKRLDERLMAEGLPHVMDILKVIETIDALPMQGTPSNHPISNLFQLLQRSGQVFDKELGFTKEALFGLLASAAERLHVGVDPLGIAQGLKDPKVFAGRLQRAVNAFMQNMGSDPNGSSDKPGS